MKRKIRWTPEARHDLVEIRRFIARDKPEAARRWVERLRASAVNAASAPFSGRRLPELDRDEIREIIVGNYRIIYRVLATEIHVLTVLEGHQLLDLYGQTDRL